MVRSTSTEKLATIKIDAEVRDLMKLHAHKGQTYSDYIFELMVKENP